jgi:hypothetical protein
MMVEGAVLGIRRVAGDGYAYLSVRLWDGGELLQARVADEYAGPDLSPGERVLATVSARAYTSRSGRAEMSYSLLGAEVLAPPTPEGLALLGLGSAARVAG